ncbi:uncharacterized protein DS421_19g645130 [Arachis hypogaea]|uniref:Uncharacterized protein n=1 Tax=Arachis hypogaea TaxID=3818 RepID=A0A6B9V594_ARAHY|nr:uncharacterized protein DS421_19g645130 [Arachis hypogaea]
MSPQAARTTLGSGWRGRHHLHSEFGHRRLRREIGERLGLGVRLDVAQARTYLVHSEATMMLTVTSSSIRFSYFQQLSMYEL